MNTQKRILIVEDDEILYTALIEEFKNNAFMVTHAIDGEDAIKQALAQMPDIVLLDINIPKLSGMQVMEKIRKEGGEWGRTAKIILLTNLNADDTILEGVIKYTPTFYLIKAEVKLETIVAKVNECLGV